MEHPQLEHSLNVSHSCGAEWSLNVVEWPSSVVVCPACHDLLTLERFDKTNGNTIYKSLGTYADYKVDKAERKKEDG